MLSKFTSDRYVLEFVSCYLISFAGGKDGNLDKGGVYHFLLFSSYVNLIYWPTHLPNFKSSLLPESLTAH